MSYKKDILIFILINLVFLLVGIKSYRNTYKIWRWKRNLGIPKHLKHFNSLVQDANGFAISKAARKDIDAPEYTYGEITFTSFIALLSQVNPNKNTVFYDLGSGVGKANIACAMIFDIKKNIGIEIFKELQSASLRLKKRLLSHPKYSNSAKKISFINGNYLNYDFSDANLIFINATGLFGGTWVALNKKLDELTEEVILITTTKCLIYKKFYIKKETRLEMSWGVVNAFIHAPAPK